MWKLASAASLVVCVSPFAGCGGGGPPGPSAATVSVTATPATWAAAACPPSHCGPLQGELEVIGTLTLRESAGVGANVESIGVEARSMAGAPLFRLTFDAATVARDAGTSRNLGRGMLAVPISLHFPPSSRPSTIAFTVTYLDDGGHRTSDGVNVRCCDRAGRKLLPSADEYAVFAHQGPSWLPDGPAFPPLA
jgi:hypothetical protein